MELSVRIFPSHDEAVAADLAAWPELSARASSGGRVVARNASPLEVRKR